MNQKEFLKLFNKNINKIQYSAGDDLKSKKGHHDRGFKGVINESEIKPLNKIGFGIYFTVNKFPAGQRKKNKVLRVRAVWVEDDDSGKLITDWPLPPSIVVNSSKNKYHYYWLTNTKKYDEFERVMQTMVDEHNCDKKARDISRVLRVPSTYHHKAGKFRVKVIGGNFRKYKWEVIKTAFPPAEKKKSNYTDSHGTFSMKSAVQELVSTNDLHGSMISIALSCAGRGMNKELFNQTMHILHQGINYDDVDHKRQGDIASRFDERHLDECYDSAVEKINGELAPVRKITRSEKQKSITPQLPEDLLNTWPEPWPLIWKEFQKLPRTLEKELLLPTILSVHSYLLNSNYVTEWGLRPNLAFLGIAMSTASKDVNSKRIIRTLNQIFKDNGIKHSPFSDMASRHESITSDTAFLESFNEAENFFWINTEATHIFQQMSNSGGSNSHVKALESKIVDVVDGQEIMGKMKSGKEVKTIKDPNCQILLYTQPETISSYLKSNLIDSGLLGRMIITVHSSNKDPFDKSFVRKKKHQHRINKELLKFYENSPTKHKKKIVLMPDDEGLDTLRKWMETEIKEKAGDDDNCIKMLKRLEITAEQIYTLVLGVSKNWAEQHGKEIEKFDTQLLLPLLNYWADCKLYAIKEYINTSIDPLAEGILNAFSDLISGERAAQKNYQKAIKGYHAVPLCEVTRVISSQKKLLRNLDDNSDKKNIVERIEKITRLFERSGQLVQVEIPNKRAKYYGFPDE